MKKRKPWYRLRNIVLMVLAAALVWIIGVVRSAASARLGPQIDYAARFNELAFGGAAPDPGALNRWDDYLALVREYDAMESAFQAKSKTHRFQHLRLHVLDAALEPGDSPKRVQQLRTDQMRAAEFITELHATDFPERLEAVLMSGPVRWQMVPRRFAVIQHPPDGMSGSSIASAFVGEIGLAFDARRDQDAVVAVRRALLMARMLIGRPSQFQYTLGKSVEVSACGTIIGRCMTLDIRPETARALLAELDRMPAHSPEHVFEAERLTCLDIIQRTYSDDGNGNGILLASEVSELGYTSGGGSKVSRWSNWRGLFAPDRRETERALNEIVNTLVARSRVIPPERRAHPFPFKNETEVTAYYRNHVLGSYFTSLMTNRAQKASDYAHAMNSATRIVLALEFYQASHDAVPAALDDLVPDVIPLLPADHYASDGRFRYSVREPTEDDPRAYILYSVGPDGDDHHATPIPRGKSIFDAGPGFDLIFNPNPLAEDDTD